MGDFWMGSY